jgi:hypothetical protein
VNTQKMYVLTRKDLAETYRIVQGSHALAQYALEHYEEFKLWNNTTIVYLGVWNLMELREWSRKLAKYEKVFSLWREPDQDNAETAIACYDDGRIFKDLGLA